MSELDKIKELITSTLWGKNYSEMLKNAEQPAITKLAKLFTSHFQSAVNEARIEGIKLGWKQSAEGYNNEYTSLCHFGGKRYTDDEVLDIVIKDALAQLTTNKEKE